MMNNQTFLRKALSEGIDTAGGFIVPEQYLPDLIRLIRQRTVIEQISRHTAMNRDVMKIPSQTGGSTAYWPDENQTITDTDQVFGQVTLNAKKIAALTKASTELVEDALVVPEIATVIMEDLSSAIAVELDRVFINGDTGAGDPFDGLAFQPGIGTLPAGGVDGDKLTFDKFADAIQVLQEANLYPETRTDVYWLMNPRDLAYARKIKDDNGQYIWQPAVSNDIPATIMGIPYKVTNQIPRNLTKGTSTDCSYILLTCANEVLIGDRRQYKVEKSTEAGTAFEQDQVWFKVTARKAIALRYPVAIVKMLDLTPSGA